MFLTVCSSRRNFSLTISLANEKRAFFPDSCPSSPTDSIVLLRLLYVCQLTLVAPVVEFARITLWSVRLQLVWPSVLQAPGHLQGPSVCDAHARAQRKRCLSVLGGTSEAPYCLLRELQCDGAVELLYAVCLKGSNVNADAVLNCWVRQKQYCYVLPRRLPK